MNPIFDKVPRFASPAAAGRPADAAPPRVRTASRLAALGLAAMLPLGAFGVARAEDPPHGGGDVQAKIEEKMKEILRLMRENGKMILDVSKGGTEKPKGVEVTPPPTPPSMAEGSPSGAGTPPGGGTPPPEGNGGGDPGAEVRRRMEELLEQAGQTGAAIPRALEELVRMIPRSKSKSKPDGSPPQDPKARKPREKPEPGEQDPKDAEKSDPKDPNRDPKPKEGDKPPPDGEKSDPQSDDTPPWMAELPPEARRSILNADPERVPAQYRELMIRYQKWLAERAAKAKDGR